MNKIFLFFLLIMLGSHVFSQTEVRIVGGQSGQDERHIYPHAVLKAALDATTETDGSYVLKYSISSITRNRALIELKSGELINVHAAPTREEWEEAVIPIRIPVRKGLLGYRLFLIQEKNRQIFADLSTVEELKELTAGLGEQWSTTRVMRKLNFKIETGSDYEGLFSMLMFGRFDYFPRGINEVFLEMASHREMFPGMIIEPSKALYFTTPTYFFVSPTHPELADRIRRGMLQIIEDGTLDALFFEYFADFLEQADLSNRVIFTVENTILSEKTPLNIKEYWYIPLKLR